MKASNLKIQANRANARASTGPKTTQGRIRSARNAFRHGLSLPIHGDPVLYAKLEALAREIAGKDANAEVQALARRVAEAQIDLCRVRDARYQLLSQCLSDPHYESRANTTPKVVSQLLKPNGFEVAFAALQKYLTRTPQPKLAMILAQEVRQLSVMERYERRALSRRKSAIRALDLAKQENP